MERSQWLNLNGAWEFAETDDGEASFLGEEMPDRITVPFCRESKLSGLERKGFVKYVWYRREFEVPEDWEGKRVRFHVGACDWETTVWINGARVGFHRGSSDPFDFDITPLLKEGTNAVTLKVYDDVRTGLQPGGKQSQREESHGIYYTRTTGIWQTVWLEAVGDTFVESLSILPDPDNSKVTVETTLDGKWKDHRIEIAAFAEGAEVGTAKGDAAWGATRIDVPLTEKRLWSPKDPFLYDLKVKVLKGVTVVDEVESYFGLRKMEIQGRAILLNGEPVFQRLVLDQGFYPDGIWTAPTDAALEGDIRLSMEAGFNGARLHQKVFEPRFLYHADRLGYMVWGEFPNFGMNFNETAIDEPVIREWTNLVKRDRNHPCVVGWCPFNETPPESARLQNIILDLTQRLDPTRPVIDTSGWTHTHSDPDLSDAHDYDQNPDSYRQRWFDQFSNLLGLPARYGIVSGPASGRPFFVSEFGGIGWNIKEGWGYGATPESLEDWYERFQGLVDANLDNPNFFGYCYTQLTDIEQEQNGIFNYNREAKFDNQKLHAIQTRKAAYEEAPPVEIVSPPKVDWTVLVPTAHDRDLGGEWEFTESDPGESWAAPEFDTTGRKKGKGGFGAGIGEEFLRTDWKSEDIWLRRKFDYDGGDFDTGALVIFYDDATEVYLNGKKVWGRKRWVNKYHAFDVTKEIKSALKPGANTIAVHTHQDKGDRFIDVGLLIGILGTD
jgi:hypothetical protein